MDIKSRLKRMQTEDIQHIGDLIERNDELIQLIGCIVEDRNMEELNIGTTGIPADRILGRIEMGSKLLVDLKNFVAERNKMNEPRKRNRRTKETPLAHEPDSVGDTVKIGGQI